MSDYKSSAFEFNERVSPKPNSESSNIGPYTIPKLVIPSDEFATHQSFWSCSSSQSGSTEAEDDSRVDRDKHSDSFRLSEEYRPIQQPQIAEDGYPGNDSRRFLGKSAPNTNSFHYSQNMHSDIHMHNVQYMAHSSTFNNNQQIFTTQERFPMTNGCSRKVDVNESPRVAAQYNVNFQKQLNVDNQNQFADIRPNMRYPAASQSLYPQMTFPPHQVRQFQTSNVNLSRSNEFAVATNISYNKPPVSPLSSTYHNHASQGINTLNGMIYQVQFKCTFRHYILGVEQFHCPISVGEFVVVEADRGEDIGIVSDILPMKTFVERRIYMKASVEDDNVIGRIVRIASVAERQFLPEKFHDEDNILQFCRELSHSTYRLPMVIHDVEYQFDRHKLTVYYAADSRVDFREFVRDLFSAYKARIWMKKLNTQRPIKLENWARVALATGMQFSPDSK